MRLKDFFTYMAATSCVLFMVAMWHPMIATGIVGTLMVSFAFAVVLLCFKEVVEQQARAEWFSSLGHLIREGKVALVKRDAKGRFTRG
jgi:hypothetical protein